MSIRDQWKNFSKEKAMDIVKKSKNYRDVMEGLGYKRSSHVEPAKKIIEKYQLDISHFKHIIPNIVGMKFGKLTVLKQEKSKCYCICDCGNNIEVSYGKLNSGNIKSCGCLKAEVLKKRNQENIIDITGQRCGSLVAIKDTGESNYYGRIWEFKCDCGNIVYHPASVFTAQRIRSCGCKRNQSYGEIKVEKILKENNISYKREYTFSNLKGEGGAPLRFDFAIFNKENQLSHLIEVDGEQHRDSQHKFYSERIINHDIIKNEYCLKNKIPLIRLPYEPHCKNIKIFTLNNLKIETTKFLIQEALYNGE